MTAPSGRQEPREQVISRGLAWCARWSARWILIVLALYLAGRVFGHAWPIFQPVVLALLVTTVLAPISMMLERRLRMPPALAAATTLVGSIAAVVAVGFALAPTTAGQVGDIGKDAATGLERVEDWLRDSDLITGRQIETAIEALQTRLTDSASSIASGVLVGVGAVTSALVTAAVTLILTFLFLKDGRRFLPWLRRLAGPSAGGHLAEVLGRSWDTLGGFIRTQAKVSAIDAVFIGTGLLIVGVPLALPLAVLTFFGGFIPIVGAFVVGALAVLVALVSNGWVGALIVFGIILAVQQLEGNVLSPWLQSRSMSLHAGVVLLSVTLGSTLFGIIGAFLAVPTTAVLAVILRYLDEQVTLRSQEPPALEDPAAGPTAGPAAGPEAG